MHFIELFLLMLPGILSVYIYCRITNKEVNIHSGLFYYSFFSLLICFSANMVLALSGWPDFLWDYFPAKWVVKYIVLSISLSVLLPYMIMWGKKYFPNVRCFFKRRFTDWISKEKEPRRTKLTLSDVGLIASASLEWKNRY